MTLEEFRIFFERHKGSIRSARAYDASGRRWVEGKEILRTPGAYTLIVLQYKDKSFLRINVKPSINVTLAPEKYASASTWRDLGVFLTYEEKEFLERLDGAELTPEQLLEAVKSSDFPGRDRLASKLKAAMEQMRH
jgi:hypothetical protein